jgi:hypothetical protein
MPRLAPFNLGYRKPDQEEIADTTVPVLYIGGFGRSGSTLLDRLLGKVPEFHSGGELGGLWPQGLASDRLCSCGSLFSQCQFWRTVGKSSFSELSAGEIGEIENWLYHIFPAKRMWRLFFGRTRAQLISSAPPRFFEITAQIYQGVREASASEVIVDSSKSPTYLTLLAQVPSVRLHVVHLVRDPRAVAHSWSRPTVADPDGRSTMSRFGAVKSVLLWMIMNAGIEWTARQLRLPYVRVRYEDLVADPDRMIGQLRSEVLGEFSADLPAGEQAAGAQAAGDEVDLEVVHSISGNPMRFTRGRVAIAEDAAWKKDRPVKRAVIFAVTSPLAWRYGYRGLR